MAQIIGQQDKKNIASFLDTGIRDFTDRRYPQPVTTTVVEAPGAGSSKMFMWAALVAVAIVAYLVFKKK